MEYVLITGATSGIGAELAKLFAQDGYGLVLVSSNQKRLEDIKGRIEERHPVPVYLFEQDLTQPGAAKNIKQQVQECKLDISVLVNNAGFGLAGPTDRIDLCQDEQLLMINVTNLVALCKLFLREMYEQGSGRILNVASTGAFMPGPYTSTYFASKAFVLSYTRAIRYEAREKGIQISTLCPGATKTGFFEREGLPVPANAMPAEKVAQAAFKGLKRNKEIIIPGLMNRLMQLFPLKLKMRHVAKLKER